MLNAVYSIEMCVDKIGCFVHWKSTVFEMMQKQQKQILLRH